MSVRLLALMIMESPPIKGIIPQQLEKEKAENCADNSPPSVISALLQVLLPPVLPLQILTAGGLCTGYRLGR